MEYCRMKGVLLQAWSPLAQGVLMGNLDAQPDNVKETAALVQEYAQRHQGRRAAPRGRLETPVRSARVHQEPAGVGRRRIRSGGGVKTLQNAA